MTVALTRIAYFALYLSPIAFMTSMAAMGTTSALVFLAAFGLLVVNLKKEGLKTLVHLRSGADIPLLGFFFFSALGIVLLVDGSEAKTDAFSEYRWILLFYGYLYFFNIHLKDSWRSYLPVFAVFVVLLGWFSVFQFFSGWELPKNRQVLSPASAEYYRAVGFFNIPLTFAGIIGMCAFMLSGFAIAFWNKSSTTSTKLVALYVVSALSGFAGVVVSFTRGAWLAAAITFVFGAGVIRRSWILYALIGVVGLGGVGYTTSEVLQKRLGSIWGDNVTSNEHRKGLWFANWEMIKDRPLLGFGAEQNIDQLTNYYSKESLAHLSHKTFVGHAHNNLIQVWAGQGLFALVFYLWFSIYFFWAALWLAQRTDTGKFVRGIGLGSCYAQVYFHISGLTECNFIDLKVNHLLIFIWALTAAPYQRQRVLVRVSSS